MAHLIYSSIIPWSLSSWQIAGLVALWLVALLVVCAHILRTPD